MQDGLLGRLAFKVGLKGTEPAYSRLDSLSSPTRSARGYQLPWKLTRGFLASLAALLTFVLVYKSASHVSGFDTESTYTQIEPSNNASGPAISNLHVLIPASQADPNLCKAIASANVLGYPSPTIINWGLTFDDPAFVAGGSHLAKINGTSQWLNGLDERHDDDLVLMLDGYDAWIQLRPQTLVDRFYDINRRANKRIDSELDGRNTSQPEISQKIVFGGQKRCWPWSLEDPPCYAVPNSSLPIDIYGPDTDTDVGDEQNPYIKYRQRYLNSGVVMGTVGAMRKLFNQTLAQAPQDANFGSDQYIFSHIFGDQELYREIVRRDAGLAPRVGWNEVHIEEVRQKAAATADGTFEFGIGIDYASEIGLNTVFAEDDTEWVTYSDADQLREAQDNLGIAEENRLLRSLPADISKSTPPFEALNGVEKLPKDKWEDLLLFTDVWTGVSPVVIHHNAHRDGMKILRETWWPKIWFQKHLGSLLEMSSGGPSSYVAVANESISGEREREYWPQEVWSGGGVRGNIAKDGGYSGKWLDYQDLCRAYDAEMFRADSG